MLWWYTFKHMIEVEKLAMLSDESAYQAFIKNLIDYGAKDLGQNDTENIFYLGEGYQLKVAKLLSKNKGKFALKIRDFGDISSEEIEVHFSFDDANAAERMMDVLLSGRKKLPTAQIRHDYLLDDVEVAVKYSDDWGYHIEFEQMVDTEGEIEMALEAIDKLATRLDIQTMTKEEAGDHIRRELTRKGVL
jgi:adenylate cyclase class IV